MAAERGRCFGRTCSEVADEPREVSNSLEENLQRRVPDAVYAMDAQ
jgi:hypothetical protein